MAIIYRTIILDRNTGRVKESRDPVDVSSLQLQSQIHPLAEYYGKKLAELFLEEEAKSICS